MYGEEFTEGEPVEEEGEELLREAMRKHCWVVIAINLKSDNSMSCHDKCYSKFICGNYVFTIELSLSAWFCFLAVSLLSLSKWLMYIGVHALHKPVCCTLFSTTIVCTSDTYKTITWSSQRSYDWLSWLVCDLVLPQFLYHSGKGRLSGIEQRRNRSNYLTSTCGVWDKFWFFTSMVVFLSPNDVYVCIGSGGFGSSKHRHGGI